MACPYALLHLGLSEIRSQDHGSELGERRQTQRLDNSDTVGSLELYRILHKPYLSNYSVTGKQDIAYCGLNLTR